MSYVLPDEPRGALSPGWAVDPVWPLLTLMIVGPMPGFAWLAFNSLALGARRAHVHAALAILAIFAVPVAGIALVSLGVNRPEALLAVRLALVGVQASALLLALWLMMDQSDAREWRLLHGPPLGQGLRLFVPLVLAWLILSELLPRAVSDWIFWSGL